MRKYSVFKKIAIIIVLFIFCLILLELAVRFFHYLNENLLRSNEWNKNKRYLSSVYKDSLWAKKYFDDAERVKAVYYPFCEWRMGEFKSEFINISSDGLRKTWNPPHKENLRKIFIFGGSAIWGRGCRDEYTIPSLISKKLNKEKDLYIVINFGQPAYVATQEVILLVSELLKGNIPEYVIFYDGINDILSTFRSGRIGLINNYEEFKTRVDLTPCVFNEITKKAIMDNLQFFSFLRSINKNIIKHRDEHDYAEYVLRNLAEQTINKYHENLLLVKRLAEAYGFKYAFFWQPVLFTNKSKTAEELKTLVVHPQRFQDMTIFAYELADKLTFPHYYNLSHLFDNKTDTVFIDYCHIGEKGNRIVADKICELIKDEP